MLPFEMRAVLSEMRLFNDNLFRHGHHIYMKWKRTERVQDSGETERECVRDRAWERQEVVSVVKRAIGENVMGEIRVGLKG
jgi:hypothetical protein